MAMLFIEGFEGYVNETDMTRSGEGPCKWFGVDSGLSTAYRTAQVTVGNSRSLYAASGAGANANQLRIPANTELIAGAGFYLVSNGQPITMLGFGGTTIAGQGVVIGLNTSRQIVVATPGGTYGNPGTVLATGTTTLPQNTWHYVEARVKLGTTNGEVEVYLNNTLELNLNTLNTATGSITQYETFATLCRSSSSGLYIDDLYILDKSGTTNNNFLGPISVYSLMPSAAGSSTQFTATPAVANYLNVDDPTSDSATTYVASSTSGHQDYYGFQDLPGGVANVHAAMIKTRATLGTAGNRKLKMNIKNGASVISSTLKNLVFGTWTEDYHVSDTAPDGSAWTPTNLNASEGGVEVN